MIIRFVYIALTLFFVAASGCAPHRTTPLSNSDTVSVAAPAAVLPAPRPLSIPPQQPPVDPGEPILSEAASADTCDPALTERTSQPVLDEALELCQTSQDFWQTGDLDNALDALDQAYALILTVDTENNPKLIQQKEDYRFTISKRILEIYASRNIVVNGNHNAIPMSMNEHVEKEIKSFQNGERNFFIASYQRSGKYHAYIVAELEKNGLPQELAWLPLIESGFKAKALSKARALGLWQFIPSTGYKFGLNRDTYIDERLDFEKATAAAIAYLKELHQIFGDWATVLAAYNCGEGRVLRVIRSQNVNYLDDFWDLYQRLPRETARYVPRFLATLHILKDPARYGINLPHPDAPLSFETATVNRQVSLKQIAIRLGVSESDLKDLNPELRYNVLPAAQYRLRIPPGTSGQLLAAITDIPIAAPPGPAYALHRVRRGESLSTIARRYRTTVGKIMQANNLRKSNYIVAGNTLKIPSRGGVTPRSTACPPPSAHAPERHVVRRGDSLWILAKRYGTTTEHIKALNNLTSTRLHIGQVLRIAGSGRNTSGGGRTYVVKKGDSPFKIAQQHNTSVNRLLRLNHLGPKTTIYPGQTLYLD